MQQLFQSVINGQVEFKDPIWDNISEEAKDVVKFLLDTNPETRWSAERVLSSSWMKQKSDLLASHDLRSSSIGLKSLTEDLKLKSSARTSKLGSSFVKCMTSQFHMTADDLGVKEEDEDSWAAQLASQLTMADLNETFEEDEVDT